MRLPRPDPTIQAIIDGAKGKFVTFATIFREHTEEEFNQCAEEMVNQSFAAGFKVYRPRKGAVSDPEEGRWRVVAEHFYGDYLLFIDADQIFPPDTLVRLVAHNVPIVGTLVVAKQPPHLPVTAYGNPKEGFQSVLRWPANGLIEADVTGFGCILIKREVLEVFPDGNPFLKIFSEAKGGNLGEDWSFCLRAKELGFSIYVDTSIPIGHKGSYFFTIADYIDNYQQKAMKNCKDHKFFEPARQPKVVRRLDAHPDMKSLMRTIEGAPAKKGLALMGETGGG